MNFSQNLVTIVDKESDLGRTPILNRQVRLIWEDPEGKMTFVIYDFTGGFCLTNELMFVYINL